MMTGLIISGTEVTGYTVELKPISNQGRDCGETVTEETEDVRWMCLLRFLCAIILHFFTYRILQVYFFNPQRELSHPATIE